MKDNKLEVGDYVYERVQYSKDIRRHKIERLTPTTAICSNFKLRNKVERGCVSIVGAGVWSIKHLEIHSKEIEELYQRTVAKDIVRQIDYSTLPIEKINQLIKLLTA